MATREEKQAARERAAAMIESIGFVMTDEEKAGIEVADFGLDDLAAEGLEILVYENNPRYCAKELALFPNQTCPQHKHPPVGADPGKMETFRCRWGRVFLYVEGAPTEPIQATVPAEAPDGAYTVFHEIDMKPGDQYTIPPNTLHWFQAGPEGAVVSEFSSTSRDEADIFSDPRVQRVTKD